MVNLKSTAYQALVSFLLLGELTAAAGCCGSNSVGRRSGNGLGLIHSTVGDNYDSGCCGDKTVAKNCNPRCPTADGVKQECNGRKYILYCGKHVQTAEIPGGSNLPVTGYNECFTLCASRSDCKGFDYTNKRCWLKSDVTNPKMTPFPNKLEDNSLVFLD